MKKNIFIALTFLSMFFALPVQADVKDDTTTVVLRKTMTVNGSFNGNTGNHAPVFVPSINTGIKSNFNITMLLSETMRHSPSIMTYNFTRMLR